MLKPKKKITKREIKEDKLVTTYFEATNWYNENKKVVSTVLTIVIVLAIALIVIGNNRRANNESALTELGKILRYYDQADYQKAVQGDPQNNVRGLQAIVDDYGSTAAGERAKFVLANSYYTLKNYDKALEYFLDADLNDPLLTSSALSGAAACNEAKGDFAKAASYYERAAHKATIDMVVAENLLHAATNYETAGKKEKALELFKRIKKDYSATTYARDIDLYIARVSS